MKQPKESGPPEDVSLSEFDWNFDNVAKSELVVCCYWEYARDSAFLRSLRQRYGEAARVNLAPTEYDEFLQRDFDKAFWALSGISFVFQERLRWVDGGIVEPGFVSPFPKPWQSLSGGERAVVLGAATWKLGAGFELPGFRRATPEEAKTLANFQPKPASEVFGDAWPLPVRERFHAGSKLRAICPNYVYPNGTEVLAVKIE